MHSDFAPHFLLSHLCLPLLISGTPLLAAQSSPRAEPTQFARVADGALVIDGHLSEAAWTSAQPITRFFETYPGDIAEPNVHTDARFLYDDKNIYIGIRSYDPDPSGIRSSLVRRDTVTTDQDYVEVLIDPLNTRRSATVFRTNPAGVPNDSHFNEDSQILDSRPDAEFDVRSAIHAEGWDAEFRIPLSALRYRAGEAQTWSVVVYRNRPRSTTYTIANIPQPRSTACVMCFAAEVSGISVVTPPQSMFVTPHVTYAHSSQQHRVRGGVDAKWLSRSNTAVDLTIAPDFSQVEADDLQLNANARFALLLKEKRPFFLEGSDLLDMPLNPIYTRSFGDPSVGARITHREANIDYLLLALHDKGGGVIFEPGAKSSLAIPQQGGSTAVVGRYRRQEGGLSWGALASARVNDGTGSNYNTGLDATWTIGNTDRISGQLLLSGTQNPNEPSLSPTWDGRKLTGAASALTWQHASERWFSSFMHEAYSRGFRDWNGFLPQVGVSILTASTSRPFYPRERLVERITPTLIYMSARELGGGTVTADVSAGVSFSFPYDTELSVQWHPRREEATGAGLRSYEYFSAGISTTPAAWLQKPSLSISAGQGVDFDTGSIDDVMSWELSLPLRWQQLEVTAALGHQAHYSRDPVTRGRRRFAQRNHQVQVLWHFTPRFYSQALLQSSKFEAQEGEMSGGIGSRTTSLSALLSYQANWQTRYFLGVRHNDGNSGTEIFAKFSYMLPAFR